MTIEAPTAARHTLPSGHYYSPEQYAIEQEQLWYEQWVFAGRADQVAKPGQFLTIDIAGQGVLVTRNNANELRAFYNVCSHRGAVLCDDTRGEIKAVFQCPYHAWCYDLNGSLVATPRVEQGEVDRSVLGLKPVHVDDWQGFLFVNLSRATPTPLREALDAHYDSPIRFEKHEMDRLVTVHRSESVVAANWKILIENYNECLHCPIVHPELVEVVPTYKKGITGDRSREDGGVALITGGTSYSDDPRARKAVLPGMNDEMAHSIYGSQVFPNMFLDIAGSNVVATRLVPEGPLQTRVLTEYLFLPEDIAEPDFDHQPVVDFCELVAGQDYAVSERVQRGITSRGFVHGVYPAKDDYVHQFNQYYRQVMNEA
ncbi:MAG: aromatic ring-hydroxylating dioxygenase subunit alpha [Actinomycetia bacterium]|nr:aromatic ring-hydroxylating dioxygenase subunit alpha [Actinomycetes bacterium]